jgi:hypothetical protein
MRRTAPQVQAVGRDVVRYALPHLAAGCLAGLTAAGGIVATHVGSLRDLMLRTPGGRLASCPASGLR